VLIVETARARGCSHCRQGLVADLVRSGPLLLASRRRRSTYPNLFACLQYCNNALSVLISQLGIQLSGNRTSFRRDSIEKNHILLAEIS
jgi:hypothetical protein